MSKKIIAVVGATGAQGGGLVRAILDDAGGGFAARALTRKTDSDKAKTLAAAGAEVVAADLDDEASLRRAFEGAHGVFGVTNFWEHFSPEKEMAQAANMARAAKAEQVGHFIWSTLEDTRRWVPLDDPRMPTLMGKYKVPHLDAKGESDAVFAASGVPTTFLLTSFYWENFIYFGLNPKPGADGKLTLTLPMGSAPLAGIASDDIGRCVYGIFQEGAGLAGKYVGVAAEFLTGEEMAAAFSEALGQPVVYYAMPAAMFRGLGFPGADDLGNMFQFFDEFAVQVREHREPAMARKLNPRIQTFREWLAANKSRIPLS
jgi:uncharacterized protein YbjT (DUF2867 family)